jgi:addiction module HigA family antidote
LIIIEVVMSQFAFEQVHPGAVLKEELQARGLTANAFALRLRVPPQRIQDIVAGRRGISPETALRLEASLGTPARMWLAMQAAYDLSRAETEFGERVRREVAAA